MTSRLRLTILSLGLVVAVVVVGWVVAARWLDRAEMVDVMCPPGGEQPRHDWTGICRYRADNARIVASRQPVRAVVMGDSITEWWGESDPALFSGDVINRGITGQTSAQLVLRFRHDVTALRPRVVVLQVGLNDIAGRTGRSSPGEFMANYETLIDLARASGAVPVVASLPPAETIPDRADIAVIPRVAQLNRLLRELAARRGLVYADFHAALAGPTGKPRAGLTIDGVHPSKAGYAAMRPVLEAALARAEQESDKR